jgi:toxin ParE1/3/4
VTLRVEIERGAEDDLAAALEWHEQRRPGLALVLMAEFHRVVEYLLERPNLGKQVDDLNLPVSVRRHPLRRFNYSLVYFVDGSVLRIVALWHHSRRPDFWRGRIPG